tara:strand:+ start:1115 stop:1909 length:795 start_codon:yes stop_codon:yes gene_type:complete
MNVISKIAAFLYRDFLILKSYKLDIILQAAMALVIPLVAYFLTKISTIETSFSERFASNLFSLILIDYMFSIMGVFSLRVREAQLQGNFEILFLTKTSFEFILMVSSISTILRCWLRSLIYISAANIFFSTDIPINLIPSILMLSLICILPFLGIGLLSASFIIIFKKGNPINFLVGLVSIIFSNIFFQNEVLPLFFDKLYEFSPIFIGNEMLLTLTYSAFLDTSFFQNFLIILSYSVFLLFFGIITVKYAIKKSKENGTLNQY